MIEARVTKRNGKYVGFECNGHADFDEYGKDIVCASVSVLTINTLNSIEKFCCTDFTYDSQDGYIKWEFTTDCDDKTTLLMDSMVLGLSQIQENYNKNFLLNVKEV